ncbi:unnamed protein product [Closterium sp. NIES-53]
MAAQELRWLTYLLTDLGEPPRSPPVLYVDNKAMLALCREQRLEHRTKHIALRYFLARELQQRGQLRLAYVASEANTADVFTKALAPCDHQRCCTQLGLPPCARFPTSSRLPADRVNMGFVPEGPSDSTPLKPDSESSEAPPHGSADAAASHAPAAGLPAFQYAHHPHHPPARGAYPPQFPPPPGCPSAVVVVAHGASGGEFPVFSPAPIPGLYMLPPRVPPSPDMVILGYETCAPPTGCCAMATLSGVGWLAAIVAFIFCWPLTCLPCCIPQLHERCQRPVFGYPPADPAPGFPAAPL